MKLEFDFHLLYGCYSITFILNQTKYLRLIILLLDDQVWSCIIFSFKHFVYNIYILFLVVSMSSMIL